MDVYVAQIDWIPSVQGGRKSLPLGSKYYPIIITEGNVFDSQNECWSVIVSDTQIVDASDVSKTVSKIQYLSEKAPNNLFPGIKFMLYEGSKLVANGIVLYKTTRIKDF